MQISSIGSSITGLDKVNKVSGAKSEQSFTDILNEAMKDAGETDAAAQQQNVDLLTGENDSIHSAMITSEKAELALNLVIQVRNKVVDAYNEVMRMQV